MVMALLMCCCSADNEVQAQNEGTMTEKINLTIDGKTMTMTLADTQAARELADALKAGSISVTLEDNRFEQYGSLGRSLTTSNQQISAQAGDVLLYSGSYICLFYGSNSYSYTRLGKIEYQSLDELKTFLKAGQDNVKLTLSLANTTGIKGVRGDTTTDVYYSLNGQRVDNPKHGIYIKNGKKVIL